MALKVSSQMINNVEAKLKGKPGIDDNMLAMLVSLLRASQHLPAIFAATDKAYAKDAKPRASTKYHARIGLAKRYATGNEDREPAKVIETEYPVLENDVVKQRQHAAISKAFGALETMLAAFGSNDIAKEVNKLRVKFSES
jgi:hypothetical protein